MSIMIEGMEMPKCCDACSFACWSNLHQTGSCYLLDSEQCFDDYSTDYRTKRSEHCPLTEVPEPHGRLIDADKLRENEFVHDGDAYAVVMSRDIKQAPTIIPASKGEWV